MTVAAPCVQSLCKDAAAAQRSLMTNTYSGDYTFRLHVEQCPRCPCLLCWCCCHACAKYQDVKAGRCSPRTSIGAGMAESASQHSLAVELLQQHCKSLLRMLACHNRLQEATQQVSAKNRDPAFVHMSAVAYPAGAS
jgi:hypothetical protein